MHEKKAAEVLRKHGISVDDIREQRTTLHHLRKLVRSENQGFDVFREIVKLRR
jgi:uroporphyrinogen-III synthase